MEIYFKASAVGLGFGYFAGTTATVPENIATKCIEAGIAIKVSDKVKAEKLAEKEAKATTKKK